MSNDNNGKDNGLDAFDDILFSSDEELSQRPPEQATTPSIEQAPSPSQARTSASESPEEYARRKKAKEATARRMKAAAQAAMSAEDAAEDSVEGALFSDDAALEQALDNEPEATKTTPKEPVDKPVEDALFADESEMEQMFDAADQIPTLDVDAAEPEFEDALFADGDALEQAMDADDQQPSAAVADNEDDEEVADALFGSDEELEKALDEMPAATAKVAKKKVAQPVAVKPLPVSFDAFTYAEDNTSALQALSATAPGLAIAARRLNMSLVAEVDWQVPETLDEDLLEEIRQQQQREQDELDRKAREEAEAPKTKKALLQKLVRGKKEQFDDYFGRTLPERELALNFKFPPYIKDTETLLTAKQIQDIFAKKKESLSTIFKKSERALQVISSRELSASKQEHLLSAFYKPLIEKILAFIAVCQKKPALPLADEQKELMDMCLATLKYAIAGYKQLYALYYESSNVLYGPKRDVANLTAFRLLELLALEQQLNAALYRGHSNGSSHTFNKIYNALCEYEADFVKSEQESQLFNEVLSVDELFKRFQIEQAFDLTGITASLHKRVRSYFIDRSQLVLPLTAEQLSSAWVDGCWIISHEHEGRARFGLETDIKHLPARYLHIEPFLLQLQKDFAQAIHLLQMHGLDELSGMLDIRAFSLLKGQDILHILTVINQQLISIEKNVRLPKYTVFKNFDCEVDVFAGMEQTQTFFRRWYKDKSEAHLKGSSANNDDVSVISSKKKRGGSGGYWDVAMEDEQSIYLQTAETKLCPSLDVGSLLLLVKHFEVAGDDGELELAVPLRINSIERGLSNKFVVVAEKLGQRSMAVTLNVEGQEPAMAIIAVADDGSRQLVTDCAVHFNSGDVLQMILPDDSCAELNVSALKSVSTQLQVYTVF